MLNDGCVYKRTLDDIIDCGMFVSGFENQTASSLNNEHLGRMTTITDTTILNWLPFDDDGGELWKFAQGSAENQTQNGTDLNNSTTSLAMMVAASRHGANNSMFASPAHLGLATGLLLSLIINSRIWTTKANREVFGHKLLFGNRKPYQWILHLTPSSSFTFASSKTFILPYLYLLPIVAILLLLPILSALTILLLPFVTYRLIVYLYLQRLSKSPIKKNLFSGADAVWTFNESYQSFSVINALIILEGQPDIEKLREILRIRLGSFPKLKMRHGFTLGYATWYEDPDLDLGNLVQWIPGTWGNPDGKGTYSASSSTVGERRDCDFNIESPSRSTWDRNNLSKIVEQLCNVPLPECHTVSWEARVGKAMPWSEGNEDVHDSMTLHLNEDSVSGPTVFPILFRIHHSVGDGASLLQLLMSTLIDDGSDLPIPISMIGNEKTDLTSVTRPLTFASPKDVGQKATHYKQTQPELDEEIKDTPPNEVRDLNNRNRTTDYPIKNEGGHPQNVNNEEPKGKESSFLYGRQLSGKKTILWDSTSVTVEEIKKVRSATGVKFTEILLSAISAALSTYWETRERDQLHDAKETKPRRHRETGKGSSDTGHRMRPTRECESEDDWDRLEDVEEESEEDGQRDCALEKERIAKVDKPPASVKLVLPAILGSLFQKQKDLSLESGKDLENLFSVAVMTLPVGKSGGCPLQRLSKVSESSGYMMPLRKDSLVTCESKMKNVMSNTEEMSKQSAKHVGVADTPAMDKEAPKIFQDPAYEMPSAHHDGEKGSRCSPTTEEFEPEPIKTDEPKVLTYYYTKQTVCQVKSSPHVSPPVTKTAQVQYCKNSDSAKVILQEKEPYHCPTTIFFTQNKEKSVDFKPLRECPPRIDSLVQNVEKVSRTHNTEITSQSVTYSRESGVPREIQSVNKNGANSSPAVQTSNQNESNQASKSAPSIQFPSSPTIQHLLTRWLALDVVATVLPSIFAAPMMSVAANGVAVVMSNLPGPPKRLESILGGHPLKDIVFWAPHRGCTGLGVTILSYDGRLHVGLMADKAVVPTQAGAQLLMNTILDELHSLGAAVSCSR